MLYNHSMRRYAFIDVPNTTGTAREVLDFSIDWSSLYSLLVNDKWSCTNVFFYKGFKGGKEEDQLRKISDIGYIVRTKLTHVHPDWIKDIPVACPSCNKEFVHEQTIRGHHKSNCDVELTVDSLETLKDGDEMMLFTGDGDFAYLIERLLEKNITIKIVSSMNTDRFKKIRFSTRLKDIIEREEASGNPRVQFIHLKNWQKRIEKVET